MTVWEVERDRHGVMFSGPLEVGECVRVVPEQEAERLREAIRELLDAGDDLETLADSFHSYAVRWQDAKADLRAALAGSEAPGRSER